MSELIPDLPVQVSLADQIACVKREVAMRRKVYPRWVAAGKMTQAKADTEISCMLAAAATLHQPGTVPRLPLGAIADLRALIPDIDATERALAELMARAREGGWWVD